MKIELSNRAVNDLTNLKNNRKLAVKIADAIDNIAENPYCGKALVGQFAGILSYRVGDWRILYDIHNDHLRILILRVAHRREIYKKN